MDKGSTILELSRSHVLPRSREEIISIPMEEVVRIIIMAPRMVTRMEEATAEPYQPINASQERPKPSHLL